MLKLLFGLLILVTNFFYSNPSLGQQLSANESHFINADIYRSREDLRRFTLQLCTKPRTEDLSASIKSFFGKKILKSEILNEKDEQSSTFTFGGIRDGIIRIRQSNDGLSVLYRQTANTIEPIFHMQLSANCIEQSFSFTYYNSKLIPIRREFSYANSMQVRRVNLKPDVKNTLIETPNNALKVGIIDTGVDYNHPKLIAKMRPLLGIDLYSQDNLPFDYTTTVMNELSTRRFSHGTAVADILSRNLNVYIVPVRVYSRVDLAGDAIEYLAHQGVRLVNLSMGTENITEWLAYKAALKRHPEMLVIVAAGNESQNIDVQPTYPASFSIDNQIVVASIDDNGGFSSFSNYGSVHVDLAARGNKIPAAEAGGTTWSPSGTSFAAPQITHLASEILLQHPNLTTAELKKIIFERAVKNSVSDGKLKFGIIDFDNQMIEEKKQTGFTLPGEFSLETLSSSH